MSLLNSYCPTPTTFLKGGGLLWSEQARLVREVRVILVPVRLGRDHLVREVRVILVPVRLGRDRLVPLHVRRDRLVPLHVRRDRLVRECRLL